MFRGMDLSSWQSIVSTIAGLVLITLLGVGIRLVMMMTIQQRRERMNRQINERLKTLIAAYKTLGGSFTGKLSVDPTHMRDLRRRQREAEAGASGDSGGIAPSPSDMAASDMVITATEAEAAQLPPIDLAAVAREEGAAGGEEGSDRARRIRDAVEAALSDIILLGTEDQVRLATLAATELVSGRPVHTHELVVSLRAFIRDALDLDPIPDHIAIPMQGPARPASGGSGGRGGSGGGQGGGGGGRGGGGAGGGGMAMGMGMGGMGVGMGLGHGSGDDSADGR